MIKIQSYTRPIVWQVDNTQELPNVSGVVRWNGAIAEFEVCDSLGNWHVIDSSVELECQEDAAEILDWARKKMHEEKELDKLSEKYPAVQDAKQNLDIILKLVKDDTSKSD